MSDTNATPTLDLSKGRVVTLLENKKAKPPVPGAEPETPEKNVNTYTFTCRRITPEDWRKYFAAISMKTSNGDEGNIRELDLQTPYIVLVNLVLEDATGYKIAGGGDLKSLPNWKDCIPLAHRLQLGRVLSSARIAQDSDDLTIYAEGEAISIDATWSTGEDGLMQKFEGLKHVLAAPSEAQFKRYSAEASRSIVVGGSRNGTTIFRGPTAMLAALYDELVVSYTVDGKPLQGREQIVREMDYHHKVTAAQELFQPARVVAVAGDELK